MFKNKLKENKAIFLIQTIAIYTLAILFGIFVGVCAFLCLWLYQNNSNELNYLSASATFFVGFLGFLIQLAILLSNGKRTKNKTIANTNDLYKNFNQKYENNILLINIVLINQNESFTTLCDNLIAYNVCPDFDAASIYIQQKMLEFLNWIEEIENLQKSGQYDLKLFDNYFEQKLKIVKSVIDWYNKKQGGNIQNETKHTS